MGFVTWDNVSYDACDIKSKYAMGSIDEEGVSLHAHKPFPLSSVRKSRCNAYDGHYAGNDIEWIEVITPPCASTVQHPKCDSHGNIENIGGDTKFSHLLNEVFPMNAEVSTPREEEHGRDREAMRIRPNARDVACS